MRDYMAANRRTQDALDELVLANTNVAQTRYPDECEAVGRAIANARSSEVSTPQSTTPDILASRSDGLPTSPPKRVDGVDHFGRDRSLRPRTVDELLLQDSPTWIVRDVLPEKSLGVVFGASGSGKTFLVLDLAATISRKGVRWFGCRVRNGGVVYVAGEGSLKSRLKAYLIRHSVAADELRRLRVVSSSVNLFALESGDLDTLIAEIRKVAGELGGVVLVILDTLNAMMAGGDENASKDMGAMLAAARGIMDAIGCSVLFVHHSGKDESKGSRGHSSLKAAVDMEMQVTGNEGGRVAEVIKLRDGETGRRMGFRLESVDLGPDPDPEADEGDRISSCVIQPLDQAPEKAKPKIRRVVALDALREAISEFGQKMPATSTIPAGVKAVTLDQWKARWVLRTGYDDSTGNSISVNFHKDRKELLDTGSIVISKPYVWVSK
ncbi:MAG: AAA family ATPase [Burkholderiales bacterium]|nr:AAA family ATPase [Burkholderiales bacterium]